MLICAVLRIYSQRKKKRYVGVRDRRISLPQMMHVVEAGSLIEKQDTASYYTVYIVNNRLSSVNKISV